MYKPVTVSYLHNPASDTDIQEISLLDSVGLLGRIKKDLGIVLSERDVNYIYTIKKKQGPWIATQSYGPPIIPGLTSQHTRNDLLAKARTIGKQKLKSDNSTPRVGYTITSDYQNKHKKYSFKRARL